MKANGWRANCLRLMSAMLLLFPALVSADTFIKQVTTADAFEVMGQKVPAQIDTSIVWLSKDMARMDQGDTSSILLLPEKNLMYMINRNSKTYTEMSMDVFGAMSKAMEGDSASEAAAEMMKGMMAAMQLKVKVTPTDVKEKVGDWNCAKYNIDLNMGIGSVQSEAWATEDPKIDYELFQKISKSFMVSMPGFTEALEEMRKVKGITVKTVGTASVMGANVKTTTEVLEISEKAAPAGTFEIPSDYKKTEGMPGMMGQ